MPLETDEFSGNSSILVFPQLLNHQIGLTSRAFWKNRRDVDPSHPCCFGVHELYVEYPPGKAATFLSRTRRSLQRPTQACLQTKDPMEKAAMIGCDEKGQYAGAHEEAHVPAISFLRSCGLYRSGRPR